MHYILASLNLATTIVCLSEGKIAPPYGLGPFWGSFRAHFRARRRKTVQSSQAGKENLGIKYSSTSNINNNFFKTLPVISQICAKIRILLQNGREEYVTPQDKVECCSSCILVKPFRMDWIFHWL